MTSSDDFTPGPDDERPIAALATLVEDVPETLRGRIHRSIERRTLAGDVVELTFNQILQVFLEFLKVTFEGLRGRAPERDVDE
ncbi:MAG: hypothetical protein ACR2QM_06635 [Longimicrobiales bacterium]